MSGSKEELSPNERLRVLFELFNNNAGAESIRNAVIELVTDESTVNYNNGSTLLHNACEMEEGESETVIKTLIDKGANVNAVDQFGYTPLQRACNKGNEAAVKLLLENDANVNVVTKDGSTPLHFACQSSASIVNLLIEKGADVNAVDNSGNTPLHSACSKGTGSADIVSLLIKENVNFNAANKAGDTPLHLACAAGNKEVVKKLLESGANVDALNKNNELPMKHATQDICKLLYNHPANKEENKAEPKSVKNKQEDISDAQVSGSNEESKVDNKENSKTNVNKKT